MQVHVVKTVPVIITYIMSNGANNIQMWPNVKMSLSNVRKQTAFVLTCYKQK